MSIRGIAIGFAVAGLACLHSGACAQATRAPASERASTVPADSDHAVRHFVQAFYDWYTPIALSDVRNPAWYYVLNNAGRYLDRGTSQKTRVWSHRTRTFRLTSKASMWRRGDGSPTSLSASSESSSALSQTGSYLARSQPAAHLAPL
jgi:hypothetical protein